jgi:hypothetical protein
MLFPSVSVDVYDVLFARINWSRACPTGMAPMLIVVAPVIAELILQVGHGPEEGLIK